MMIGALRDQNAKHLDDEFPNLESETKTYLKISKIRRSRGSKPPSQTMFRCLKIDALECCVEGDKVQHGLNLIGTSFSYFQVRPDKLRQKELDSFNGLLPTYPTSQSPG